MASGPRSRLAVSRSGEGHHHVGKTEKTATPAVLTKVILANVNTLAANSKGNIDAVVDDERHFVLPCDCVQSLGCRHHDTGVARLVSVLHYCDAALERFLDDMANVSVAEDGSGRVSDKVKRVVNNLPSHGAKLC